MADTEVCYTGGPAPPWLDKNAWYIPVAVPKEHVEKMPRIALHRVELKVNMCCKKCAEIVSEEIRYLGGVFNVEVDQKASKVTVTGRPDPDRVLRRARKVDRHATFWPAPPPPPPAPPAPPAVEPPKEPEKPKEEEKPKEPEEKKEEKKPEEAKPAEETKPAEEKPKEVEKPKEGGKPKDEAAGPAMRFPPYEYMSFEGYPGGPFGLEYRPSQDYQRAYSGEYGYMGMYGATMPLMNPNYFKHVKIAY